MLAGPFAAALGAGQYKPWEEVNTLTGPREGRVLQNSFPRDYFLNFLPAVNPPWEPYHPGPFPQVGIAS